MGNSMRGMVPIDVDGEQHFMRFDMHALVEVKEYLGIKVKGTTWMDEYFSDPEKWAFPEDYIALITSGLRAGSLPDITTRDVGKMMLISDLKKYMEIIGKAILASNIGSTEVSDKPKNPLARTEGSGTTLLLKSG